MRVLDRWVHPALTLTESLAWDLGLLARARETGRGAVHVYAIDGEGVSLGRFHAAPSRDERLLRRRVSGGRAMPAGEGFLGASLALPHRSYLVADDPFALAPAQVLNRAVRGLLHALTALGVVASYPGLDQVTAGGRPIACVSYGVEAGGVALVDAIVAVTEDFTRLPHLLDRVDPGGVVPAAVVGADAVTSVVRETGRAPTVAHFADLLAAGHVATFGVGGAPGPAEWRPPRPDGGAWLASRVLRPELDRRARTLTMLGAVEAHVRLDADGRIAAGLLTGDVIADAPTIARIEAGVVGLGPDVARLAAAIAAATAPADSVLLGVHPLRVLAETFARAAA